MRPFDPEWLMINLILTLVPAVGATAGKYLVLGLTVQTPRHRILLVGVVEAALAFLILFLHAPLASAGPAAVVAGGFIVAVFIPNLCLLQTRNQTLDDLLKRPNNLLAAFGLASIYPALFAAFLFVFFGFFFHI